MTSEQCGPRQWVAITAEPDGPDSSEWCIEVRDAEGNGAQFRFVQGGLRPGESRLLTEGWVNGSATIADLTSRLESTTAALVLCEAARKVEAKEKAELEARLAGIVTELERKSKDLRAWEIDARTLEAKLAESEKENAEWAVRGLAAIKDLEDRAKQGRCSYCGYVGEQSDFPAHVETCSKHPMAAVRTENDVFRTLLERALDEERCDHAAEPCSWCGPVRAALKPTEGSEP